MERNRRIAKAYTRASNISINGSDTPFDGHRIGMNGFENKSSDAKTEELKKLIGKVRKSGASFLSRAAKNVRECEKLKLQEKCALRALKNESVARAGESGRPGKEIMTLAR